MVIFFSCIKLMVVKKSSRRSVGRPRGSRNRKTSRKPSRKTSRKSSRRSVGRPRGSRSRSRKPSRKPSRRSVGRPRGSRSRKPSRKSTRKGSKAQITGIYSLSQRKMIPLSQLRNMTTKKVTRNGRTTFLLQAIDTKGNKVSRIISKQDYDNQLYESPSVYHTPELIVKKKRSKKTFGELLSELNIG